ncbi:uncharacterized protein LAESUDRAFT_538202 [Laetiporus sulphureus 93-53]|uniref:Uncharacterized protein n=1 Tax=Laetiporus sulphureus 93-53 TaxID=1314785 RepID=A0A165FKI2_9APHY|nr:uncharacterized protein LAESUDRAFT_538202 [Laetiporus sulphureus 93-53]KZT09110.1 hypothetical protein LAESUDRAFT_538202 [Laetiporus sulphureus 93-53]
MPSSWLTRSLKVLSVPLDTNVMILTLSMHICLFLEVSVELRYPRSCCCFVLLVVVLCWSDYTLDASVIQFFT